MALPLITFTITLKTVLIFLHLVGAATWIGALALYVIVVRPNSSSDLEASRRAVEASRRLDQLVWWSLFVLLVTGTWNTIENPVSRTLTGGLVGSFEELERLGDTPFGSALRIKHGFFLLLMALMAYRSYRLLPRLSKSVEEGNAEGARAVEARLDQASKAILALGYVILLFAAIIVFSLR